MSYVRTTFVYAFTTRCDARVVWSHNHFAHSWAAPARPLFVLSALTAVCSHTYTQKHTRQEPRRTASPGGTRTAEARSRAWWCAVFVEARHHAASVAQGDSPARARTEVGVVLALSADGVAATGGSGLVEAQRLHGRQKLAGSSLHPHGTHIAS